VYEIGLSTPGFINEQLFANMAEAGIKHIEISVDKRQSDALDYGKIKEWSEKYDINLWSFHLPFYPFSEIDISNPDLAEKSVEYFKGFIEKASGIGIRKYVIHASGEPIDEKDRRARMECAKNSLYKLAEIAKGYDGIICVEDLPRTCLGRSSDDILELISAHENLKVCFDTNHLLMEGHVEFIEKIAHKTVTLHVSDYDFLNERHWLPGEGKINWNEVYSTLVKCGYNGVWMYEVTSGSSNTITRERALLPEDYVKNATEIFEGLELTKRGITADGLKAWR